MRVPADERRGGWTLLLDREIRNRRIAAIQQVSIDLATIHVRCVQELGTGQGLSGAAHVLDRALHGLSVRATRQLDTDAAAVIERVFPQLLDTASAAVLARITAAARRTVDSLPTTSTPATTRCCSPPTSAVATVAGAAAVDSLSAARRLEPADRVLPGLGSPSTPAAIALAAEDGGCAPRPEKKDCRRWLQQALRGVEVEMARRAGRALTTDLRQALAIIVGTRSTMACCSLDGTMLVWRRRKSYRLRRPASRLTRCPRPTVRG